MNNTEKVHKDIYNVLLQNFISYERLYEMTIKALYGDRDKFGEINFFIDLNSYFKAIWNPPQYSYKNNNVLAASVINACAHYRSYFASRHNVKTNIYLVWGYNCPTILPLAYNAHFREKVATHEKAHDLLKATLDILKVMCPYLPEIYFIDAGEYEVSGVIYTLASDMVAPTVVLTRDVYAYQLVAYCPTTFVFRPVKKHINTGAFPEGGGIADMSWVVTKKNLFKAYRHALNYAISGPYPDDPKYLEYVLGLAGLRSRHIKGDMTFNRACAVVGDVEDYAPEQLRSIDTFAYSLFMNPIDKLKGLGIKSDRAIVERADMLNVTRAAKDYQDSPEYPALKTSIVNLYDPQGIQEIAAKEYEAYPINIVDL